MKEINILGFGVMARQIGALFLLLGYKIHIYNKTVINQELLLKQFKLLQRKLACDKLEFKQENITCHLGFDIIKDLITLESVSENLQVKKQLIKNFKTKFKNPIFSNSSSLSFHDLSCPLMHFFNPIYIKLVEIHNPNNEGIEFIKDLQNHDFTIIHSKGNRAALANLILFGEISNLFKIIEQLRYNKEECQIIYNILYEKRNIFNIIDTIGIDICEEICANIHEQDCNFYHPKSFKKALKENIFGKKNKTSIKDILL
ncbi:hypothetical protein DZC71_00045 [Campylobacter hepaticus]|uniref:3-hydroxyacyl-CoA dehydrogenase NAD binding domain-containing protein n=1 Tax=Campylobacter hepaticus TaxID=1813019 RepID=A0A424Z201_9BACT|nr:3-hydroxyacyl-CoA dehydrogenase NAD-binding domain-containing protein [Campylobacter hepaticus]RQD69228.1 hypothetical protein DZC71_00045 [Campylobacter hepaticus]RQD88245.1 hypothetical protein DZD40_01375 [Campylobacter hepaticus]